VARLYSRTGAVAHDHPEYGHFEAGKDGGFDFPDELSDELLRFHVGKQPIWEDQVGRQARTAAEEEARMRDPATLATLVAELVRAAQPSQAEAPKSAPAAKAATAAKAADAK
jgi:hypothetical protein